MAAKLAVAPVLSEGFEDFIKEFQEIEDEKDGGDEEEDLPKTPDEGEEEAEWLKTAGYGFIVSKFQDGRDLSDDELEALTSSLTRKQAEAVKRRVDTLSTTMRKHKHNQKVHVKDIFNPPEDQSATSSSSSSDAAKGEKPPSSPESGQSSQFGNHRNRDRAAFLKKGEYSMSGLHTLEVLQNDAQSGVQGLSFKPKTTHGKKKSKFGGSALPAISDSDITVDFHMREVPTQQKVDQHLPVFETKTDKGGVIKIGDISPEDMVRIGSLALIELTALFDSCNIVYTKSKRKIKSKDHGLFGVPLQTLVEQDQKKGYQTQVPLIFTKLISHLEKIGLTTEGILRVPGAVNRVKQLRQELNEKFYSGHFNWDELLPNDAAAIMKQFLRELPVPLLTYDYIDAFPQISNLKSTLEQLYALNLLILLLPDCHRHTLKLLIMFLRNVVAHSNENKMGLTNVAMIMAPNLFLAPSSRNKIKTVQEVELNRAAGTSKIITFLINYQDHLWNIPSSFITQIRHQYDEVQRRKVREKKVILFRRKEKSEVYKKSQEPEAQDRVIRVQAPHLTKSSALIQLDDRMSASDVVARFKRATGSHNDTNSDHTNGQNNRGSTFCNPDNAQFAEDNAYLFEVGGNIGERCIEPRAHMLSIYKTNPTAQWIIKVKADR